MIWGNAKAPLSILRATLKAERFYFLPMFDDSL